MADPPLLCVNCGAAPPAHRRRWDSCKLCVRRNLPATYYCGEACMEAHWPKHRAWHKAQKERARERLEGTMAEADRSEAEEAARRAEETGGDAAECFAYAFSLMPLEDYNAAAKAWRKIIQRWPEHAANAYHNLGVVLQRSSRRAEAAPMYLKAMERYEDDTKFWADAVGAAFDVLKAPDCDDAPKPEWWNDEALNALSARVVAASSDEPQPCAMRGRVLMGAALYEPQWNAGPRTAAEIKEAATWHRRTVMLAHTSQDKLLYEDLACRCDAVADPLLAEEEKEASKARAAAAAEEAEALKVAEAKAQSAAEELLAEEEKEKAQAAGTKPGKAKNKGKKGKGKR